MKDKKMTKSSSLHLIVIAHAGHTKNKPPRKKPGTVLLI